MIYRLYQMVFRKDEEIDRDVYEDISNFLAKGDGGNYGEILFPTRTHFENKAHFKLNNKMLVSLHADNPHSAAYYSLDFVHFLLEREYNYMMMFCWKPLIYFSFKDPNHISESVTERILEKYDKLILEPECSADSFSFRLDCQFQEFDVYINHFLGKFESEGCEVDVEYYFCGCQ